MITRTSIVVAALLASSTQAANVYILSSDSAAIDNAVVSTLQALGHTATIGVPYYSFDGSQSLAGFQAVYLQANSNWTSPNMPAAGQSQLLSFITAGGGLVTCEWTIWKAAAQSNFQIIAPSFAAQITVPYDSNPTAQFDAVTPDPAMNAGLPNSFTAPLDSYAGTETQFAPQAGATVFYHNPLNGYEAVVGRGYGSGRVLNFATTNGPSQLADTNFARLFANAFTWSTGGSCYANCDGSTTAPVLNVLDFSCFLNRFASGAAYANCDGSTTTPVLNVLDFSCFLNRFAAGCP